MRIVGIDLGTTHCAVASVDPSRGAGAPVEDFALPQLVRQGEVAPRALLPSTVYVPAGHELAEGSLTLPWGDDGGPWVVGELARWQGARVPGRLVASAKSWLCHPGVDRSAPILPWGAPADVQKLSPVDASALLLTHMARAWDYAHPDAPLSKQEVVITVPASFDEAARALTVSAARKAGLEKFTLLEEPQAAFYDYTARHRADLEQTLSNVRLVLVVDVGGGTTDFTLVHAGVSPEGPMLRRLAVGDHLMLGGDNMDAALARRMEEKLFTDGRRLSATQWTQAIQAARTAKEALLGLAPPEKHGVSLVSGGSKLLGGTLSTELTRDEAQALVLDGFFPLTTPADRPRRAARMALQELGLPYVQDAAVTRHLAAFLAQHAAAGFAALGETAPAEGALPRPDAILLNGGVFNSPQISERLVEALSAWWPNAPRIPLLRHESLELAVARGAAYYGLVRRGHGLRIGGGAARAYYVGLQRAADSAEQPALCLIPRGFEEGQKVDLGERPFSLTLGRPVQFQLYSTTSDRIDKPGDLVPLVEDLKPLPPIHTLLKGASNKVAEVPVHLQAALTEIGTLELYCVSNVADERWRLEFELRGTGGSHELTVTESMPARFVEAKDNIERVYGNKPLPIGPKDVKQLGRTLEKALGSRETWRVPVLREMWSTLFAGASKRRRSEDHERVFYSLTGFSLRPGFGYPLDGWRAEQTFGLFDAMVQHHTDKAVWTEFWVMWRRIAGGLDEARQQKLYAYLQPHLARKVPPDAPPPGKLKGIQPEGLEEMVRTAASLEHLQPGDKAELGRWIAARLRAEAKSGGPWAWSLGRLGARVPLYGSSHKVVDVDTAEAWLTLLLELDLRKIDGASFAAAQLARLTGDRTRDLDPDLRERTAQALLAAKASETWVRMVREVVALEAADEARALGDTLPAGLRLS
ncbi:Hsp70 family protein [Myxococcus xanthus]|uniref:Molecular chaperone DnaK n=1 Tax=Myxococcus xanthus TaxID=34 RepID=A0AAE6KUI2_MYXXA|nr:Hsp70 family protein [Myxococcus xanthus]QDE70281.1 molecular chaperone DnaK [Myxococcus xanthus]QDE77560.1 molecular chaperone DnaK [Myxococcus xanthus]QDE99103.1 molecular chaperone DnaK [Myxococcus xanthus]QDF06782.1 molecular chaperone DnaK [Myxococcus xanthus]